MDQTQPSHSAADLADLFADTDAPVDRAVVELDARRLPPPEPLRRTLERLADLADDAMLVQLNDRVPQHLFPLLDERGFRYATADAADPVVTVIWRVTA